MTIDKPNLVGKETPLINNQTFPITRYWFSRALYLIPSNSKIFSSDLMRHARKEFIAGKNMLAGIKEWLIATQLIKSSGRQIDITDKAKIFTEEDSKLNKSSSWWSIHLQIIYSMEKSEPYTSLFMIISDKWKTKDELLEIFESTELTQKRASLDSSLEGILRTVAHDGPLESLRLIEHRHKNSTEKTVYRRGDPNVPDEAIIYALILARARHAPDAVTLNFDSLLKWGLHHALCLSAQTLRERLRAVYRDPRWAGWFRFEEGNNMNSVYIDTLLNEANALRRLLQEAPDTWF